MTLNTILIDDDPISRLLHRKILEKFNLRVSPAEFVTASTAIEHLNSTAKDVDRYVILLDIHMPVMTGWQFLDIISGKSYANKIRVIIISTSRDHEDVERARRYEQVIGFFEKPITKDSMNEIKKLVLASVIPR